MITLSPLPRCDVLLVHHLLLPYHQEPFVGDIAEMTADQDVQQDFHLCRAKEGVVGFFKVDTDFSRLKPTLPNGAHGLRGVLIGGQYQGRGYGSALFAALPGYIAQQYDVDRLYLAVDAENTIATALYLRHGWTKIGAPVPGRSGPEHLMHLALPAL